MPPPNNLAIPSACEFNAKFIKKHMHAGQTWTVQRKMDGQRRLIYKDHGGSIHAIGKRTSTVTGIREDVIHKLGPRIRDLAKGLPPGMAVDGEVVVDGMEASDVPTYMKEDSELLHFVAFGVPYVDFQYKPHWETGTQMEWARTYGFDWVLWHAYSASRFMMTDFDTVLKQLKSDAAANDAEGWIVKRTYADPMAKIKLRRTWDMVVTGTTDANEGKTGKYIGLIGALKCSVYEGGKLVEKCQCSGMTDAQRIEFSNNPPIGQVVEIEGQMVAARGRIRHPQFKRMRPDKNATDCGWPQVG